MAARQLAAVALLAALATAAVAVARRALGPGRAPAASSSPARSSCRSSSPAPPQPCPAAQRPPLPAVGRHWAAAAVGRFLFGGRRRTDPPGDGGDGPSAPRHPGTIMGPGGDGPVNAVCPSAVPSEHLLGQLVLYTLISQLSPEEIQEIIAQIRFRLHPN